MDVVVLKRKSVHVADEHKATKTVVYARKWAFEKVAETISLCGFQ
jgi:hypothetical protein